MEISTTEFYDKINSSSTLVVAIFGAEWSGTADMLRNVLDEVVRNFGTNVDLIWTDIEDCQDLADEWGIREVPTTLMFQDGEVVHHFTGLLSRNKVRQKIESLI